YNKHENFRFYPKEGDDIKTAGIIAEYNPFHNGHKYHIEKTREITGADAVIAIMSGNFVQRGDIAVADKFSRAKSALLGGADLVIELPCIYACQSAEFFAKGAVEIAEILKCNYLSFGIEDDDIDSILKIAEFLKSPNHGFKEELSKLHKSGISYPKALSSVLKSHGFGDSLDYPNNLLAAEYLKNIKTAIPVGIKREGTVHDGKGSASDIRRMIFESDDYRDLVPPSTFKILENQNISCKTLSDIAVYKLRTMPLKEISILPDVSEGLENRIKEMAKKSLDIWELAEMIKTKRYTMARIRRIIINAVIGINKTDIGKSPEYIRILGMNKKGTEVLKNLRSKTSVPIITKTADAPKSRMLEIDTGASDIYSIISHSPALSDYKKPPVIL
ncbi:MAG: nucleotidyltransferase, partial [Clostridia bacterium]|nr:nucleotidyltransferase [Clostridia bacterium]